LNFCRCISGDGTSKGAFTLARIVARDFGVRPEKKQMIGRDHAACEAPENFRQLPQ
jgi:hypothetical protein